MSGGDSTAKATTISNESVTTGEERQISIDDPESSAKPINSPLVLQCRNCRTIIGDTCSVVDLNPEMRTITLEKKSENTLLGDELHTSLDSLDYGSTFHIINCRHCGTALGRMYRTTSRELDLWRGQYTYSSEVLSFYELSAEFDTLTTMNPTSTFITNTMMANSSNNITNNNNTNTNNNYNSPSNDNIDDSTREPSKVFNHVQSSLEISKLQRFCLHLYERMEKLERDLSSVKSR